MKVDQAMTWSELGDIGASYRKVDYWATVGAIALDFVSQDGRNRSDGGSGSRRRFSHADRERLVVIGRASRVFPNGIPTEVVKALWDALSAGVWREKFAAQRGWGIVYVGRNGRGWQVADSFRDHWTAAFALRVG